MSVRSQDSKDPRAELVALLLVPIGGRVVEFSRVPLMRWLLPSFRRKPESRPLILDPGFRRDDGVG